MTDELAHARGDAWFPAAPVRTIEAAGAFLDSVGFALLFAAQGTFAGRGLAAPSLWEAVAGPDAEPMGGSGWGEIEQLVWGWKDELPLRGSGWYGKFLYRRGSFLTPDLLAALYPGDGDDDDHRTIDLSPAAHLIADALRGGPLTTAALREVVGDKKQYEKGSLELQRHLLICAAGTKEQRVGWPASVVDLTCRMFDVGGRHDPRAAAAAFARTMIETSPRELARAYGWPLGQAREMLASL
jgi:hypothetical protein